MREAGRSGTHRSQEGMATAPESEIQSLQPGCTLAFPGNMSWMEPLPIQGSVSRPQPDSLDKPEGDRGVGGSGRAEAQLKHWWA